MKKLLLLIAGVASLVSCVQNIEGVDTSLGYTTITVGMPESRTSIGAKGESDAYQIYWSEGDKIVANGAASTKMEIGEGGKSATFSFETAVLNPPYHLTYPYTANSACAKGRPTVVFAANQEYVENTFGVGYAPMCGYVEGGKASMKHLAGVLQFRVKGTGQLSTIEIVAEEGMALAGEFDVDCKSAEITPIANTTTNTITYTANQTLTEADTLFYITVPKDLAGVCKVILTDSKGMKMNLKWTAKGVEAGVVREFKSFEFKGGATLTLKEMSSITDELDVVEREEPTSGVWGYIKYDDGTPAVGVSVSDGFSVATTDVFGMYHFVGGVDKRTKYIYYSIPSTAKVTANVNNTVDFYQRYSTSTQRYDFELEKIEKEDSFSLFVFADTHGARENYLARLSAECVPGLKRERERRGASQPCYAIICGDIVCASSSSSSLAEERKQASYYMPEMVKRLAMTNTGGVPVFYVMGNHDHDRNYFDNPPYSDFDDFLYHIQDAYEDNFGPANYSFNRGDTHIVCMRDILWEMDNLTGKTSKGEKCGFTDEQVEWLRADLANVTEDKKVVLCVHIPLSDRYKDTYPSVKTIVDMIAEYNEPQIFSGHTHTNRDVKAGSTKFGFESAVPVSEKTIVGNWGTGSGSNGNPTLRCMGDGAPFGFDVYDVSGAQFTDHYYVDCTSNLCHAVDTGYVMRAYLSDDVYGGDSDGDGEFYVNSNHVSHLRYFKFYDDVFYHDGSERRLHVNIFNGTADTWSLKLYINKTAVSNKAYWVTPSNKNAWSTVDPTTNFVWSTTYGKGTGEYDSPWMSTPGNSQDWWYISYIINETAATSSQISNGACNHKWNFTLTEEQFAEIKAGNFYIEATHTEFGKTRTYRTSKIFGQKDYNGYINYNPKSE